MKRTKILCIDDDKNLQTVVGAYLEDSDCDATPAYSGAEAEAALATGDFGIVLLDLGLPDVDGLKLLSRIREQTGAPIIIVSGKNDTTERIIGLEMGADDYITKPFELRELVARIKAVLRRIEETVASITGARQEDGGAEKPERIRFGDWCLDRLQYQLYTGDGRSAELTAGEFRLLEALALSPNRVLTRDYLFEITRDIPSESFDRAVDIQIGRIRKKMRAHANDAEIIRTVRGVGYMFCGGQKNA